MFALLSGGVPRRRKKKEKSELIWPIKYRGNKWFPSFHGGERKRRRALRKNERRGIVVTVINSGFASSRSSGGRAKKSSAATLSFPPVSSFFMSAKKVWTASFFGPVKNHRKTKLLIELSISFSRRKAVLCVKKNSLNFLGILFFLCQTFLNIKFLPRGKRKVGQLF